MKTQKQLLVTLTILLTMSAFSQRAEEKRLTVQDLDFLVGIWEISFDLYNAKNPEKGVQSTEKGFQICEYGLPTNDLPMFIICTGEVTNEKGRKRSFQESIRYGNFSKSYERFGLFSHWPSASKEILSYDPTKRVITIEGSLGYSRGRIEKFHDVIEFDESLTSYTRTHKSNLSDMPEGEFNLGLTGTARKIN